MSGEQIVLADLGKLYYGMRADRGARSDFNVLAYDGVRAYLNILIELGGFMDYRGGVYFCRHISGFHNLIRSIKELSRHP